MKQTAGYSQTPLAKKLGIKEGFVIQLINEPDYYWELFTDLPEQLVIEKKKDNKKNFIHYFTESAKDLQRDMSHLKNAIKEDGMIWISWPKKSSKVPTDITEDFVRAIAIQNGLVDIKVCAVDEIWSGLKLVIPVKERKR